LRLVISQPDAALYIQPPMFEITVAVQMTANVLCRNGLQAEFARVPFADTSVYKVPEELTDEDVLFLADILPTAFEVGVLNGGVQPGDTVAIVGAGPIGLATIMTA